MNPGKDIELLLFHDGLGVEELIGGVMDIPVVTLLGTISLPLPFINDVKIPAGDAPLTGMLTRISTSDPLFISETETFPGEKLIGAKEGVEEFN
jgi:hypothetical protein